MALRRKIFMMGTPKPAAERRRSVRHIAVLQVAKLRGIAGEELCLLRDVSDAGLRAEVYGPATVGEQVTVELRTGHGIAGEVMWIDSPMIGLRFLQEVPILSMLAHCAFDERLTPLRPPRIDIDLPATLAIAGETVAARAINISQAGLCVAVGRAIEGDTACTVALPGLAAREGRVRWSHRGECGLQLVRPLSYREFAAWRVRLPTALLGEAPGGAG